MAKSKGGGLAKISSAELRAARAGGFKQEKPPKPKRDATVAQLRAYIKRHNKWVSNAKKKAREEKQRKQLRRKVFGS